MATHCDLQVRHSKDYSKINFWWTIPLKSYQSHTISPFLELMPAQIWMKLIFLNFCNLLWGIFKYDINTEEWLAVINLIIILLNSSFFVEQFLWSRIWHTLHHFSFHQCRLKSLPTKLLFPKLSISISKILIVNREI